MLLTLRASTSRITQSSIRSFTTSRTVLQKADLLPSVETPNPLDLLTKIGRGAEKSLAPKAESWEALTEIWKKGGEGIKETGLGVKERRYVLWALSKYSQGYSPSSFLHPPKPAKKYRGWGAKVQHGKRVK